MSRLNLEDPLITDPLLQKGIKGGVHVQTLGGALTIDRDMAFIAAFDPGGATRILTLPAAEKGLHWIFINTADAAEDLTINAPGAVTVGTISQDEMGLVVSDGVSWFCGVLKET